MNKPGWAWWHMSVTPATQEVEVKELWFNTSLGKINLRPI
jgi:hypothetical protein